MRWAFVTISALVSCMPSLAEAQPSVLDDERLAPVRARLTAAVDEARRDRLPAEWLLDKVSEGLSKRIAPERIAAAVDVLAERIRIADALVAPAGRAERRRVLRAAVDALAAGAPRRELGSLVREIARSGGAEGRSRRVQEALVTVAELTERQFGGAAAVAATRDAHRRGERPRELLRRARHLGREPPDRRDRALRELGRGRGLGNRGVDVGSRGGEHGQRANPGRGRR